MSVNDLDIPPNATILAIAGFFATAKPSGPFLYSLVALAALAMGIQSAAVQALGLPDISTTYITGTYTTFISRLVGTSALFEYFEKHG